MLYQSLKLTNGIWVLAELKIQPGNPNFMVRILMAVLFRFLPYFIFCFHCPHSCSLSPFVYFTSILHHLVPWLVS